MDGTNICLLHSSLSHKNCGSVPVYNFTFLSNSHFNIIPHLCPVLPRTLDVKYKENLNSIHISTQHVEGHDCKLCSERTESNPYHCKLCSSYNACIHYGLFLWHMINLLLQYRHVCVCIVLVGHVY
jgi:hypothetical protein